MKEIEFLVQGSAPEPYRVTFIKDKDNLNAFCTCPAGENGQYSKHRFAILAGDAKAITSKNIDQVATICRWLPGTNLEATLTELAEAEHEYDAARERLIIAKKKVAQAMRK
jgi:uncharacterized Zn finger protein